MYNLPWKDRPVHFVFFQSNLFTDFRKHFQSQLASFQTCWIPTQLTTNEHSHALFPFKAVNCMRHCWSSVSCLICVHVWAAEILVHLELQMSPRLTSPSKWTRTTFSSWIGFNIVPSFVFTKLTNWHKWFGINFCCVLVITQIIAFHVYIWYSQYYHSWNKAWFSRPRRHQCSYM